MLPTAFFQSSFANLFSIRSIWEFCLLHILASIVLSIFKILDISWVYLKFDLNLQSSHSSILTWRIPGKVEPGGLLSMGWHRVGHNWSDLAAAAVADEVKCIFICPLDTRLSSLVKCLLKGHGVILLLCFL